MELLIYIEIFVFLNVEIKLNQWKKNVMTVMIFLSMVVLIVNFNVIYIAIIALMVNVKHVKKDII